MSQAIEYIKKAQNGHDISRFELEKIYQDEESLEYMINCLEDSLFKPFMFKKISENIKKGSLGPLGSFYPVDETYKQNNKKARAVKGFGHVLKQTARELVLTPTGTITFFKLRFLSRFDNTVRLLSRFEKCKVFVLF